MINKLFDYELNISTSLAVTEVEQRLKEVTFLSDPFRVIFPESVMDNQRFVGEVGDGRFHLRKPTRYEGGKAAYIGVRIKGEITSDSGKTRICTTFYHWWRSYYVIGFGLLTILVCGFAGLSQQRIELALICLAACCYIAIFAHQMVKQVDEDIAFLVNLAEGNLESKK